MLLQFGKSKATSSLKFALFVEQGKELDDYLQLRYSRVSKMVAKSKTCPHGLNLSKRLNAPVYVTLMYSRTEVFIHSNINSREAINE